MSQQALPRDDGHSEARRHLAEIVASEAVKQIEVAPDPSLVSRRELAGARRVLDQLTHLLQELGSPTDPAIPSSKS